jgi:hypothetical protein
MRNKDDLAHVRIDRRELPRPDSEVFDRMAFARRALRLLKPPEMTVAVFEGCLCVRAETGRDLRNGPSATWAMLSIPPFASRVEIALAIAGLAGRSPDPYVLDLLLAMPPRAA